MTTDKSQVDIIPSYFKKMIENEAKDKAFVVVNYTPHQIAKSNWEKGAEFGYSLGIAGRSKTHDEKEQRVKELESCLRWLYIAVNTGGECSPPMEKAKQLLNK